MYAWQQQPGESAAWYNKFQTYYLAQGPGASLLEAENRYRAEKGRRKSDSNSGAWQREARRTDWSARSEAYWTAQGEMSVEDTADSITAQQTAINESRTALASHTSLAIEALREIATDPNAPTSSRVAAANSILDRAGVIKHTPEVEEPSPPPPSWDLSQLTSDQLRTFIELARLAGSAAGEGD
jgi:hypothetical protein